MSLILILIKKLLSGIKSLISLTWIPSCGCLHKKAWDTEMWDQSCGTHMLHPGWSSQGSANGKKMKTCVVKDKLLIVL